VPVAPPSSAGVYDPVTTILNTCRVRLNDKMPSLQAYSGKLLDETQATTQQAFNSGWRRLQENLAECGVERFKGDIVISNIPPVTNMDPASKCYISWVEFFDGTNFQTQPVLPSELVTPLWMSERPSNSNLPFPDPRCPNMKCEVDGMRTWPKVQCNRWWEWRQERIFFPGSIIPVDFRIGYRLCMLDFVDIDNTHWYELNVPLRWCMDALAWWVVAEFCLARSADGEADMVAVAQGCEEKAMEATKRYANRDIMKNERVQVRRTPYGGGSRGQRNGNGWSGYGGY
jgi:hypothetical protein